MDAVRTTGTDRRTLSSCNLQLWHICFYLFMSVQPSSGSFFGNGVNQYSSFHSGFDTLLFDRVKQLKWKIFCTSICCRFACARSADSHHRFSDFRSQKNPLRDLSLVKLGRFYQRRWRSIENFRKLQGSRNVVARVFSAVHLRRYGGFHIVPSKLRTGALAASTDGISLWLLRTYGCLLSNVARR